MQIAGVHELPARAGNSFIIVRWNRCPWAKMGGYTYATFNSPVTVPATEAAAGNLVGVGATLS